MWWPFVPSRESVAAGSSSRLPGCILDPCIWFSQWHKWQHSHPRLAFVPEQCFVQSWLMYLSIYVSLSPEKYCDQHLILYDKSVYENVLGLEMFGIGWLCSWFMGWWDGLICVWLRLIGLSLFSIWLGVIKGLFSSLIASKIHVTSNV